MYNEWKLKPHDHDEKVVVHSAARYDWITHRTELAATTVREVWH